MRITTEPPRQTVDETWILNAATPMLSQLYPGITGDQIRDALDAYFAHADACPAATGLLTRREAAEWLHVSMPTVARLLKSGRLERFATSKRLVRVTEESVAKLIESNRKYCGEVSHE